MAADSIRWIASNRIDFHPSVPHQEVDAFELFAYCCEIRDTAKIHPLRVRFDAASDRYVVNLDGNSYARDSRLLEASRKIGLSPLLCQMSGNDERPGEHAIFDSPHGPSPRTSHGEALELPSHAVNALFEALHASIIIWSCRKRMRTKSSVLRTADDGDWTQEALSALWRKFRKGDRFRCGRDVRRYVNGILAKQAARTAKHAKRTVPLASVWHANGASVPDELIAAADHRHLQAIAESMDKWTEDTRQALDDVLAGLPVNEGMAVKACLNGTTLKAAAEAAGLTIGVIRGLLARLKRGPLALALRRTRRDLETLYRMSPRTASNIKLGRLARLLPDPENPIGKNARRAQN